MVKTHYQLVIQHMFPGQIIAQSDSKEKMLKAQSLLTPEFKKGSKVIKETWKVDEGDGRKMWPVQKEYYFFRPAFEDGIEELGLDEISC